MTGSIVIGTIIDRARRTLIELEVGATSAVDVRWDRVRELLPHANEAQRVIAKHIPSACQKSANILLTAGSEQSLPTDGKFLFDGLHNMGEDGGTVGRALGLIDRTVLSRIDPRWMTATGDDVELYVYDQRAPTKFFVYPRPSGPWYLRLSYAANPAPVAAENIDDEGDGLISIDDGHANDMHDFIVGYALLKSSSDGSVSRAAVFLTRFENSTGITLDRQTAMQPLDQAAAVAAANALGKP